MGLLEPRMAASSAARSHSLSPMKEKSRGATNDKKRGKSLKEKRAIKHAKKAERERRAE